MKKTKEFPKFVIIFYCYVVFRLLNLLLIWRGIPNLLTWMEDKDRAMSNMVVVINLTLTVGVLYFFGWIPFTIFTVAITLVQYLLFKFKK